MAGATTDDLILLDENEAVPQMQSHQRQRDCFSNPQPIIEVLVQSVGGLDTFHVHRQLLVDSAPIFRKKLGMTGGGDGTGAGASLTLPPKVTTADFGLYVEALYHLNFCSGPESIPATSNGKPVSLSGNINLLKAARLAGDQSMQRITEEAIHRQIRTWWSVKNWELYRGKAAELAHRFQTLYQHCKLNDLPFGEDIAAAVANVPPSLFARLATALETNFLVAVSKKFGERMDSEGRQRARESGKSKACEKKRKASHISQDD